MKDMIMATPSPLHRERERERGGGGGGGVQNGVNLSFVAPSNGEL